MFEFADADPEAQKISSLFTYDGYHEYYKLNLTEFVERAEREAWILEENPEPLGVVAKQELGSELLDLYFADYIRTWDTMLKNLDVVSFSSMPAASDALNTASSSASPIKRVLEVTAHNTTLADEKLLGAAGKLADKAASKNRFGRLFQSATGETAGGNVSLPEMVVNEHFERINGVVTAGDAGSSELAPILQLLSELYGQLDGIARGYGGDPTAVVTGGPGAEVLRRVQIEAARQPEPLRRWLMEFGGNSRSVAYISARDQINPGMAGICLPGLPCGPERTLPLCRRCQSGDTAGGFRPIVSSGRADR